LIAVIFRDFVHKWYAQITSDVGFVEEVVTVIAHVTRALEERLRKVSPPQTNKPYKPDGLLMRQIDLEAVLLDEIPAIIWNHIRGTTKSMCRIDVFRLSIGESKDGWRVYPLHGL